MVVVQVPGEAQLRVPAAPLVPAPLPDEPELPVLARPVKLPVLAAWRVVVVPLALLVLAVLVVARLVVEPEVLLHLRSHRSFSAAMAKSSPSPGPPTCEPVRRSKWQPRGRTCHSP